MSRGTFNQIVGLVSTKYTSEPIHINFNYIWIREILNKSKWFMLHKDVNFSLELYTCILPGQLN